MAVGRKALAEANARIETRGYSRVSPSYGASVEHLPAAFWACFAESLATQAAEGGLDTSEWSLIQAARELGYHSGHHIISSATWSAFIAPLDSDEANAGDVLHTAFAALSGLGLDDCDIVELVPFERLVLRVYGYRKLLVSGRARTRRTAALVVRGLCAAVMDLAYAGPYDEIDGSGGGMFTCSQSRSVERGDTCDEFTARRQLA